MAWRHVAHGVGADLTTKPNRGRGSPYALETRWVDECGLVSGVSDSVDVLDAGRSTCRLSAAKIRPSR
jgi:hypothetical protein